MHSCLYECLVIHNRLKPVKKRFHYRFFMFYIDLDEIDTLKRKLLFLGHNRFNIFNFRDKDHLGFSQDTAQGLSTREQIDTYLAKQGLDASKFKIMLLTNLCTFGYQFNPVSFYFCIDENKEPVCSVVEVRDAYGAQMPYFISPQQLRGHRFYLDTPKNFYISPFIDQDVSFLFNLEVPGRSFASKIDDFDHKGKKFMSTLVGKRRSLNNRNLIWYSIQFPFVIIRIISLIHWHALKMWLRGFPYHRKTDQEELQQEVYKSFRF
ncbi:DUF1365 domain-containing protein [Solitalea koreensis]|uniref:DUF1365 domain-containing protein n=1 Tax=Solitalea koreensis TaxID=543615 RepID=A0A521C576_9SPHI|nr:DUF1365 domain-containing protein [Solitalea koreensis]SMO53981.1 hypothetical protein SAMN06265350_103187 [Solitalea koreensis]